VFFVAKSYRFATFQINEAVASLIIHVKDEEDMGPEFVAVPPVTRLREDTPVSSYVLQGIQKQTFFSR